MLMVEVFGWSPKSHADKSWQILETCEYLVLTWVQANHVWPQFSYFLCKNFAIIPRSLLIATHPVENDISWSRHTKNAFSANKRPTKRHQQDPLFWCGSRYHLGKQSQKYLGFLLLSYNVSLEVCSYIGKLKKYHLIIKIIVSHAQSHLLLIRFANSHLIVGIDQIKLDKLFSQT